MGRKAECQERAGVGLARIGDDALIHATSGLERHGEEKAILEVFDADVVRVESLADDLGKPRPEALRPVRRIIVEPLAILAAEATLLSSHRFDQLLLSWIDGVRAQIGLRC